MSKFALIVREDITKIKTEEELKLTIQLHTDWAKILMEKGQLEDGWGLKETGCLLRKSDEKIQQHEIPNPDSAFGGVYIIQANTYDEAIAIAKECPTFALGDQIEVRELI